MFVQGQGNGECGVCICLSAVPDQNNMEN